MIFNHGCCRLFCPINWAIERPHCWIVLFWSWPSHWGRDSWPQLHSLCQRFSESPQKNGLPFLAFWSRRAGGQWKTQNALHVLCGRRQRRPGETEAWKPSECAGMHRSPDELTSLASMCLFLSISIDLALVDVKLRFCGFEFCPGCTVDVCYVLGGKKHGWISIPGIAKDSFCLSKHWLAESTLDRIYEQYAKKDGIGLKDCQLVKVFLQLKRNKVRRFHGLMHVCMFDVCLMYVWCMFDVCCIIRLFLAVGMILS